MAKDSILHYPEYVDIQQTLERLDSIASAAETHGVLCGLLVVDTDISIAQWVDGLVDVVDLSHAQLRGQMPVLQTLFQATQQGLLNESFAFYLLLPDDSTVLSQRCDAIQKWVEGFLYGLALTPFDRSPEEVREILNDFSQITKLDNDALEESEENENNLNELVEYVRMTVLYLAQLSTQATTH